MKTLLSTLFLLTSSIVCIAQDDFYTEEFELSFSTTMNGGEFVYNGKAHSFKIKVVSDSIRTTEHPNFITVGNRIVQSNAVPLPSSRLDLKKLTIEQQKEVLNGYVEYELDYFKNEIHLVCQNLQLEWVTVDARLWLIWSFDVPKQKATEGTSKPATSQIYASTICFNQVLDLNIPVLKGDSKAKCKEHIHELMNGLKLFDKKL